MARVAADAETARELGAPEGLHIAGDEGARSHLLAGSAASIRNLTRRAAAAGVAVEVLGIALALHSPAMAGCAAPLRSVLAGTRFAPPRRRLISTVTGRPVMPGDDLAELLASQLSLPALFARAMALAAAQADLIVVAGPDDGLALAADCCAAPVVTIPSVPVTGRPGRPRPLGLCPAGRSLDRRRGDQRCLGPAPSATSPIRPRPHRRWVGTWAIPLDVGCGAWPRSGLRSGLRSGGRDGNHGPFGIRLIGPGREGSPNRGAAAWPTCRPGEVSRPVPGQLDVVAIEAEPGACHVQAPHPGRALADFRDRLVPVRVQVGAPGGQGLA